MGRISVRLVLVVTLVAPGVVFAALQSMSDSAMSAVAGRDGLSIEADGQATADQIRWRTDSNDPTWDNGARWDGVTIGSLTTPSELTVDVAGDGVSDPEVAVRATWQDFLFRLDGAAAIGDPAAASIGTLAVQSTGNYSGIVEDGLFNTGSSEARVDISSVGDVFLRQGPVGSPEFSLTNFNFGFRTTDGTYNLGTGEGNPGTGTFGLDADGVFLASPHLDFDLFFDVMFAEHPDEDLDFDSRKPMALFGWRGALDDALLRLDGGGLSYSNFTADYQAGRGRPASEAGVEYTNVVFRANDGEIPANPDLANAAWTGTPSVTEGLNILAQWKFDSSQGTSETGYSWLLGEADDDGVVVRFWDWKTLGEGSGVEQTAYDFRIPIIVDFIGAGQGPGNMCFGGDTPTSGFVLGSGSCGAIGGEFIQLPPDDDAMSLTIRDGRLHAYNSKVDVIDPNGVPEPTFDWSLGYTFGKLDANVFLYADNIDASESTGLKSDVLLTIQSPGWWNAVQDYSGVSNIPDVYKERWATNTHFFIADTDTDADINGGGNGDEFAIGILNADLLWKADDLYIRMVDYDPGSTTPNPYSGLWLQSPTGVRYQFRGLFGGGDLLDMSDPVKIALVDVNIDTDEFAFVLAPPTGSESYAVFHGVLSLNENSYVNISEPSNPEAAFKARKISGDIWWNNGRIDLRSSSENADNKPSLTIANELRLGRSALNFDYSGGGAGVPEAGAPLVGDVDFGTDRLGSIAIPSGTWGFSISLKKQ